MLLLFANTLHKAGGWVMGRGNVEEWLREQGHGSMEALYKQGSENAEYVAMG